MENEPIDEARAENLEVVAVTRVQSEFQASLGRVIAALLACRRYQRVTVADLWALVVEPLARGRIYLGMPHAEEDQLRWPGGLTGVVIWASLSGEAEDRLRLQIEDGVHPVSLPSNDWAGGEMLWLLDVVAPNEELAAETLAAFCGDLKGAPMFAHPNVSLAVQPSVLASLEIVEAKAGHERLH
ncbi:toxin-activating lysine-acyltransferase [Ensifer sp. SL37]|uniref:toxin-activating lysine-acyltransferase n=1 Tax=Ensifer sp. SL37 TaxID=2995137 RepID=UPI002272E79C|nr:toxin-activating lysine-acyltransferase [Ensifer sp. SL37]MCY1740862.1 toxin-activating lysine-acyltransferase [Ensifer sp. SL37]